MIETALGEATGVSPDLIVLVQSENGSVVLTFLVPACMSNHFANISKSDIALIRNAVLKIEIEDTVIQLQSQMELTHAVQKQVGKEIPTLGSKSIDNL